MGVEASCSQQRWCVQKSRHDLDIEIEGHIEVQGCATESEVRWDESNSSSDEGQGFRYRGRGPAPRDLCLGSVVNARQAMSPAGDSEASIDQGFGEEMPCSVSSRSTGDADSQHSSADRRRDDGWLSCVASHSCEHELVRDASVEHVHGARQDTGYVGVKALKQALKHAPRQKIDHVAPTLSPKRTEQDERLAAMASAVAEASGKQKRTI